MQDNICRNKQKSVIDKTNFGKYRNFFINAILFACTFKGMSNPVLLFIYCLYTRQPFTFSILFKHKTERIAVVEREIMMYRYQIRTV